MNQLNFLSFFRNKLSFIIGITGVIFICSCTKDDLQPLFTNSVIKGHVRLYYGNSPENIKIVAKGPYGQKSTLTDSIGLYQISELGNGTYVLDFMKEGYGTMHQYGIQLFGNDTVTRHEMLYEKISGYSLPRFYEIYDHTTLPGFSENDIAIETSQKSGDMPVRVFLDDHKDVNYKNYKFTLRGHALRRTGFNNLLLHIGDVYQLPYESGQEVFFIVYVCNQEDPGYINNYLGIMTFSTLDNEKHSAVMSFIMP